MNIKTTHKHQFKKIYEATEFQIITKHFPDVEDLNDSKYKRHPEPSAAF